MLSVNLDQNFEEELAHYAYMASVLTEWISNEKLGNRLSAIDVLIWWASSAPAEA
jgi:hypothetical protein